MNQIKNWELKDVIMEKKEGEGNRGGENEGLTC